MNRRGLTLLELLLALALLCGLVVTSVAWTKSGLESSRELAERTRWRSAATAALDLIGEDLLTGDISERHLDREGLPVWITIDGHSLAIDARAAPFTAAERVRYDLDDETRRLSRTLLSQEPPRVVLGGVTGFSCSLHTQGLPHNSPVALTVGLRNHRGWFAARTYVVERGRKP